MISRAEKDRIRLLLRETITLLCKNGLPYKKEFNLEALIGITLDKKDVLLFSLNELIRGQNIADSDPLFTLGTTPPGGSPKKRGSKTGRPRGRPRKQPRVPSPDTRLPSPDPRLRSQNQCDQSSSDMTHLAETDPLSENDTIAGDVTVKMESQGASMDGDVSLGLTPDLESSSDDVSSSENELGTDDLTDYQRSLLDKMKEAVNQQIRTQSMDTASRDNTGLQPMDLGESQKIWQKAFETARVTRSAEPRKKVLGSGDGDRKSDGTAQDPGEPAENLPPPMCHICGKTMSTEKNLTKHVRRHLGMFSVYCDECGKGFFDRTDLNSHSAKHKDTKLYQCDICGRSYSHKRGLYKHIRKDHEGKDDKEIEEIIEKASLMQKRGVIMDVANQMQKPVTASLVPQPDTSPESMYSSAISHPSMPETPTIPHTPGLLHVSDMLQPTDPSHPSSLSDVSQLSHPSPIPQHHQPTDLSQQATSMQQALALAQASIMSPPSMIHQHGVRSSMPLSPSLPPHFQHPPSQQYPHGIHRPPYHQY